MNDGDTGDYSLLLFLFRLKRIQADEYGVCANCQDEMQQKRLEEAITGFWDIVGLLEPWHGRSYEERKGNEFRTYRQAYIDGFGVDPMDPRFKAWETEQIQKLYAGAFTPPDKAAAGATARTRARDRVPRAAGPE